MILRRFTVECFGRLSPGATIDSFSERVTLIHGPNEAGKSTLLRALEYGLFQRHKVGGREVENEILPRGDDVSPRVEIEFELDKRRYRVAKQFLRKPSSELSEERDGRFEPVAQGDAADERLRDLLDFEYAGRGLSGIERRGLAEILLVPQGHLRVTAAFGERARQRLLSVIGASVTTAGTNDLLARVHRQWSDTFTDTGREKQGSRLATVREQATANDQRVKQLALDLEHARELERRVAVDPEAENQRSGRRRLLLEARDRARVDREHGQKLESDLALAAEQVRSAEETAERAAADHRQFLAKRSAVEALRKESSEAESAVTPAEAALSEANSDLRLAEADCEAAAKMRDELDAEEATLRDLDALLAASASVAEQEKKLTAHAKLEIARVKFEEKLAERARPSRDELKRVRKLREDFQNLNGALAEFDMRVTLKAERELTWTGPDGKATLSPGETGEKRGSDPLRIEIKGVGKLLIRGPVADERPKLEQRRTKIEQELSSITRPYGTDDPERLDALLEERKDLEESLATNARDRSGLFEDDRARIAAKDEVTRQQAAIDQILSKRSEWRARQPTSRQRNSMFDVLVETRKTVKRETDRSNERRRSEQVRRDRALEQANTAKQRLAGTVAKRDSAVRELSDLSKEGRSEESYALSAVEAMQEAATRRAQQQSLAAELDMLGDLKRAVAEAESAVTEFDEKAQGKLLEVEQLRGELNALTRDGLYQKIVECDETAARLSLEVIRAELDSKALEMLSAALEEEQKRHLDALVKPISERVTRMMGHVLRERADVQFDEQLKPIGIARTGRPLIETDRLSAGTQDQVALLTRIGLGELVAEKHGRHALILDDPLVNADPDRRLRLRQILERASATLQVIAFTCDPDDWLGMTGDVKRLSLIDARDAFKRERA